jgi:hypothetical protein
VHPVTQGTYWRSERPIKTSRGEPYTIVVAKDLDNAAVGIYNADEEPVVRLNLRDRRHDGTPESTPPGFLSIPAPARSHLLGATLWSYDNPEIDTPPPGRRPVEISRVSQDPGRVVFEKLEGKPDRFFPGVTPETLARFIDDPYDALPLKDPSDAKLTERFFAALDDVQIPLFIDGQDTPLHNLPAKSPLPAWLAVAPYAIALDPDFHPQLGIDQERQGYFDTIFLSLKDQVLKGDETLTYPLAQHNNLWHSRELINV